MAGLEALAARENNSTSHCIQTALISSTPHPVFPCSDYFYSDGICTQKLIEKNGSHKEGIICYAGPPFPVKQMRSLEKIRNIAYFTQPHESNISNSIVTVLGKWANENETKISIKLHPRDKIKLYEKVLKKNNNILYLPQDSDIETIIERSDLVVTRTSSVAKEAIALGCPIVLCQWSDFDRSIIADYIVDDLKTQYRSTNESELLALLNEPNKISNCSSSISARLFAGKTVEDLRKAIEGD